MIGVTERLQKVIIAVQKKRQKKIYVVYNGKK